MRYESEVSRVGTALVERGIETNAGTHHAETIRTDQPDAIAGCILQHVPLQRLSLGAGLAEACGNDNRRLDAMLTAILNDVGHSFRRGSDDHQFHLLLNLGYGGVCLASLDHRILRIDRIQSALITAFQHVLKHDLPDRINPVAGAKHRDGLRCEKGIKIMLAHDFRYQM